MNNNRPFCLSIAGFDPTAGAGVLADVKTFEQLGIYGMAIQTSNTLQTDDQFLGVDWVGVDVILGQILTLMKKYNFEVIKIGLVRDFEMLSQIIKTIRCENSNIQIVWDSILRSSSGFLFHENKSFDLSFLEQNCTLITPNWSEFQVLWGDDPDVLIRNKPQSAVLIKGGHRSEKTGCDLLFVNDQFIEIEGESFHGKSKHGTGCVLSAAITAYLSLGHGVEKSCIEAKKYIERFILSNDFNLGYHNEI